MKRALLCLALVACAPAARIPDPASSPLSCARPLPSFDFAQVSARDRTPSAGQRTEEAAQAKRLFDAERWNEAVIQLDRVARGDTGDDEGNQQLAAYHLAVALYHAGRVGDSLAGFLAIAGRPAHLKHPETVLWLMKLAETAPVVVRGMAYYDLATAARLDNAAQHEVHEGVLFLLGRERFERGERSEARDFFARVEPASRWYPLARDCLDRVVAR